MWIGYEFGLFVLGLVGLLWGAERLVSSASHLADRLKISPMIVGITVLSIGTSLPEIATSIVSFTTNHVDVAMGNIIGSELVQITLILAIVAMIRPLKGERKQILFYGVSMLIAVMLALFVVFDNVIYWYEGLFLVLAYIGYLFYVVKKDKEQVEHKPEKVTQSWFNLSFFIVLGTALTIVGSKVMVNSIVNISRYLGMSEYIIAVFLVGFGTSLPELVVSGIAAYKKEFSMSIGNLLGSNITDPTFSFGIGALFVKSAKINSVAAQSILFLIVVFVIALGIFFWKKRFSWREAIILILLYIASFWIL